MNMADGLAVENLKLIDDIRRENLKLIAADVGGVTKLAERIGKHPAQVSQWLNGSKNSGTGKSRGMRTTTCREIEQQCGKPQGWLDVDHSNIDMLRQAVDMLTEAGWFVRPGATSRQYELALHEETALFYVVYTGPEKEELTVIKLPGISKYEGLAFDVASRWTFDNQTQAEAYAQGLADGRNLAFQPPGKLLPYLD